MLAAHESFHPVIRHEGDDERLGNEFTFVNELLCDLLARKVSADVSDLMTEKELRLAAPLLVSKALTLRNMGMPEDNPYMQGWTTALNYMISEGGVKIVDGKIQQGSNELVQEKIALLTKMFEDITKDGTSDDAKKIKDEYNKPEIYSQFTNL